MVADYLWMVIFGAVCSCLQAFLLGKPPPGNRLALQLTIDWSGLLVPALKFVQVQPVSVSFGDQQLAPEQFHTAVQFYLRLSAK